MKDKAKQSSSVKFEDENDALPGKKIHHSISVGRTTYYILIRSNYDKMDSLCLAHGKHLIILKFRITESFSDLLSTFWGENVASIIDTTYECCPALKFLSIFGLTKSLGQLEFDNFKFQGGGGGGAVRFKNKASN